MKRAPQTITSLPESPEDETRRRQRQYAIAMGIRVVCIVACVFVRGWWLLIPAIGTVVLPYVAVVLGNVGAKRRTPVEQPAVLELPPGRDAA
jgi:hypothetical protein